MKTVNLLVKLVEIRNLLASLGEDGDDIFDRHLASAHDSILEAIKEVAALL